MDNIIARINEEAPDLTEEDLDKWIVKDLVSHYKIRINQLAGRVYGAAVNELSRAAFAASAGVTIRKALVTFLFKSQHWKYGRDVNSYLLTCLKRLAAQTYWDQINAKRSSVLICPGCKVIGERVFLISEGDYQRCRNCTKETDRLGDDLKKIGAASAEALAIQARMQLHRSFALHSRRGYRCPDCDRFIPESNNGKFAISCPYVDCAFSGDMELLNAMAHPSTLTVKETISLYEPSNSANSNMEGSNATFGDRFAAETVPADFKISLNQDFKKELDTLLSVINGQIEQVKRMNSKGTYMQKLLMYEAFRSMISKFPEEMVSYLVHLRQSADFPIQARIFQEFVSLIEDRLPFTIEHRGEEIEILSISDPDLNLFVGRSTFDAVVKDEGIIPNNTIETYTGSRKFKMFGPCFLGKIIDIVDKQTNVSLRDKIKSYSFVDIQMQDVPADTQVSVTHFRIPSHYEMGSLVWLQRIRRNIVDKVYLRLHGTKRPVGQANDAKLMFA